MRHHHSPEVPRPPLAPFPIPPRRIIAFGGHWTTLGGHRGVVQACLLISWCGGVGGAIFICAAQCWSGAAGTEWVRHDPGSALDKRPGSAARRTEINKSSIQAHHRHIARNLALHSTVTVSRRRRAGSRQATYRHCLLTPRRPTHNSPPTTRWTPHRPQQRSTHR
jgi:hypothetical protein